MEINLNQLVRDINYPWPIDVGRCYGSCVAKYHDGREKFGRHYHHIRKHYEVKPACGVKNWDNSEILFINDQPVSEPIIISHQDGCDCFHYQCEYN